MKKTAIKICGIKRSDEVKIINDYPVSYAGFIFAKSKRQVDIETCRSLKSELRQDIEAVGVFVNEPIESLLEIIKACDLKVVQLHGDESVDYIKKIPVKVWKTIAVKNEESLKKVGIYDKFVDGILFETYHEKLKGGTGKSFDWSLLTENYKDGFKQETFKNVAVILAGGINPSNAKLAIDKVRPDILDVNSGVEVDGFKELAKVDKLFKELKL